METQSRTTRSKARVLESENENGSVHLKCAPKVKTNLTVLGNLTNNSIKKPAVMAPKKKPDSSTLTSKQSKTGKFSKENVNPSLPRNSINNSTEKRITRKSTKENLTPKNVKKLSNLKTSTQKPTVLGNQKKLNNPAISSISESVKQNKTRKALKENVSTKVMDNSTVLKNSTYEPASKSTVRTRKRKLSSPVLSSIGDHTKQNKTKVLKKNETLQVHQNLDIPEKLSSHSTKISSPTILRTKVDSPKLNSSSTKQSKTKKSVTPGKSSLRKLQMEPTLSLTGEDVYDFVFDAEKEPKPAKKKRIRKKKRESLYKPHTKVVQAKKNKTAAITHSETPDCVNKEAPILCSTKNTITNHLIAENQVMQFGTELDGSNTENEQLPTSILDLSSDGFHGDVPQTFMKDSRNQETETGQDMSVENCFGFYTSSQEVSVKHVASTPMKVLTSTPAYRNVSISPVHKVLQLKNLPNKPTRIDSEIARNLVSISTAPKNTMKQSLLENFIKQVETEPSKIEAPPTPPSAFSKVALLYFLTFQ